MKFISSVAFLIFITLAVLFIFENLGRVPIHLLVGRFDIPLGIIVAATFIVGTGVGLLASSFLILRYRKKMSSLTKKMALTGQEVLNLRQIPIKSRH